MILGITLITFSVIHLAPGEPVEMQMAMNPKVGKEARERLKQFYGLDRPLHEQYFTGLASLSGLISVVHSLRTIARSSIKSRNACQ
jgi:peptide/nickel transport system permease protein